MKSWKLLTSVLPCRLVNSNHRLAASAQVGTSVLDRSERGPHLQSQLPVFERSLAGLSERNVGAAPQAEVKALCADCVSGQWRQGRDRAGTRRGFFEALDVSIAPRRRKWSGTSNGSILRSSSSTG